MEWLAGIFAGVAQAVSSGAPPQLGAGLALVLLALASAVLCGFNLWRAFEGWRRSRRYRASIAPAAEGVRRDDRSLAGRVASYMASLSTDAAIRRKGPPTPVESERARRFEQEARLSGLAGRVTLEGFLEARRRLALVCGSAAFAVGLVFSTPLAVAGAVCGAVFGWRLPAHAMRSCTKERTHESERHLPEMLDVVALGMRSGLSFDSSLKIYAEHFDTVLSRELENARMQWSSGLVRRDEALRSLAASYDSVVFGRSVETIIRSIRYGSSMVESLESDAAEARSAYQAEREERVAKAPVKMMVPTGVLILPAMLILVLGPVLLELMEGGL